MNIAWVGLARVLCILVPHHGNVSNIFFKSCCDPLNGGPLAWVGHVVRSVEKLSIGQDDLGAEGQIIALMDGEHSWVVAGSGGGAGGSASGNCGGNAELGPVQLIC